jgi:hypothetical protein
MLGINKNNFFLQYSNHQREHISYMSGLKYIGFSYTNLCNDLKVFEQTMAHEHLFKLSLSLKY